MKLSILLLILILLNIMKVEKTKLISFGFVYFLKLRFSAKNKLVCQFGSASI